MLYLFLIYRATVYALNFRSLFSAHRLIFHHTQHAGFKNDLAFVLTNHYTVYLGIFFIVLIGVLSLIGLFKRSNYLTNCLLWFTIVNTNNFLYPTLTAGDYLLNQLLFFNIFFSITNSNNNSVQDVKTIFHNVALVGIKVQICLAYFLAGWFKLTDADWLEGMAVYQTFQLPEYSNVLLQNIPQSICMILAYATLVYQLLFSILIWVRPFKIYLFAFGIIQHLVIAFGMGLFSFGIIMIICYILFLKYDYSPTNFADGAEKEICED